MKKIILHIGFICFFSLSLMAQNDTIYLSFEDAASQMYAKNLSLKSAEAEKLAHEYTRKTAKGLYLPKITFSATYMKFDQDIGIDVSPLSEAYRQAFLIPASKMLPSTLVLQKEQTAMASINMLWPIFNGGKIRAANQAMDASIDESLYKIEETRNALNTELVERYYGYRLAQKAVELYKEVYEAMLLHRNNALKLEENGMISRAQRLYTEIALSQAQSDYNTAINKANTVKEALKNTLADSSEVVVTSELFLNKHMEPLRFFQEAALNNNALLKQVESKKMQAKQNHNIQKADYYPSVAIVANKELVEYQLAEMMPDWFVGVNLRWTLFDGISRTYKVKSAKATMDRVDFIQEKAEADIATYITKLYNEVLSQKEQLTSLQSTYAFATEYLRAQQKAFAEGFATSKDVVDAQTTLSKVKVGRLKIMNDYVLNLAKLLEFSGQPQLFIKYSQEGDREKENF